MSETQDPFADRPYVPPTARDVDEQASAEAPTETPVATDELEVPAEAAPVSDEVVDEPALEPALAAAIEAPADVVPAAEPVAEAPAAEPVAAEPIAAPPVEEPPAYTHRYSSEPALTAAAQAPLETPFETHAPTTTFPAAPAFDGGDPFPPAHTTGDEPPKRRGRKVVSALAIAALAAGSGFGGAYAYDELVDNNDGTTTVSSLDTGNTTNTSGPAGAVEKVASKVLPSVVQINVKGKDDAGSGTGIIISSDGEILTNNHVVEVAGDDGTLTVAFNDGSNAKATIIGTDPLTDLAVIKATGKSGLTPASLGSSADLRVGQEVVAIGSPFGLESTVTSGIISALNRPVTSNSATATSQGTTFPAVQTDAAINPGNSGGPLVDLNGNVVAINSAIRSGAAGSDAGSIGLGFAIPIDLAKNVSKQLLDGKKVEHARIGVKVGQAVSSDDITGIGALVSEVTKGGAGDKAGLKKDDIITAVNGHAVASNEALVASVRGYQPGETIKVTYQRGGKTQTVNVTLDSDGGDLKE
ncbi:putative serine protease PepD [Aeromicrobium panaciterrae]|uniref:Serine protease PepD n=1 Tax=Aeromicrobium panaciterrae TaxID=363861 RepID=A0ABU1UKD5_9ACTN|nr:trypsin-like peptidase domain-containing protein [Aeromicrobium panaciterrae]MDR7085643.1 putative serine protease PepD [Aeromicrobium panaciterrae]